MRPWDELVTEEPVLLHDMEIECARCARLYLEPQGWTDEPAFCWPCVREVNRVEHRRNMDDLRRKGLLAYWNPEWIDRREVVAEHR